MNDPQAPSDPSGRGAETGRPEGVIFTLWFVVALAGCAAAPGGASDTPGDAEAFVAPVYCGPGSFVATSGDGACMPCPSGSFTAAPGLASCAPWTVCGPGSFVAEPGTSTSDQACAACPVGTSTNGSNLRACTRDGSCPPGSERAASGECKACDPGHYCAGGDAAAQACAAGTFDDDLDATTPCAPAETCGSGQFVKTASTPISDRTCSSCPGGTFSSLPNASVCAAWKTCQPGTYVKAAGSATKDRVCASCPSATTTQTTNQSVCIPVDASECPPGWVLTESEGAAACAPCESGTYCAGGVAAKEACSEGSWDDDDASTVCVAHSRCEPGTFVSVAGTATSDRGCVACARGWGSKVANAPSCSRNALFHLGGSGNEQIVASAFQSDGSGAIVVTVTSDQSFDCGVTVPYNPDTPFLLIKLDANLKCTWVKALPAPVAVFSVAMRLLDNSDILIATTTKVPVDFGDGVVRNVAANSVTYIARIDGQTGSLLWYREAIHGNPSSPYARPEGMAVEPDNQAFVLSAFADTTIDFGGGVLTPVSSIEPIFARFSLSDGSHLWSTMLTGSGPQSFYAPSLTSDGFLVSGNARGSLALGGQCGTASWAGGGRASLLAKFVRSGEGYACAWYQTTDALCDQSWGGSITLNENGTFYHTGYYCGTKTFAGVTMTAPTGRGWDENQSAFVVAYTADGNPIWSAGGISWNTSKTLGLFSRLVNGYLVGTHNLTTSPNYGNGFTGELNGPMDSYLLKMDPQNGNVVGMVPLAVGGSQATGISGVTANGEFILTGNTDADLPIDAEVSVLGVQGYDAFVARISNPFPN